MPPPYRERHQAPRSLSAGFALIEIRRGCSRGEGRCGGLWLGGDARVVRRAPVVHEPEVVAVVGPDPVAGRAAFILVVVLADKHRVALRVIGDVEGGGAGVQRDARDRSAAPVELQQVALPGALAAANTRPRPEVAITD